MRAFVIEPVKIDIHRASAYGEICYVFPQGEQRPSIFDLDFQSRLISELEDYGYDHYEDWIVVVGSMTTVSIALSTIADYYGPVKLLVFNAQDQDYTEILIGEHNARTTGTTINEADP